MNVSENRVGDKATTCRVWVAPDAFDEYKRHNGEVPSAAQLARFLSGLDVYRVANGAEYFGTLAAGFRFTFKVRKRKGHGSGGCFTLVNAVRSAV